MDVTLCSVRLLFLRFFFARGVSRRRCMQNGRHLLFPVNLNKYTHSCRAWGSNVCVECICELFYTARRRAHSVQASQRVRLLCTRSMSYTHQHIIRKFYYLFVFRRSMYSRVHLHGRRYEFSTSLPRYAPDIHSLFSSAAIFFPLVARCVLSFVFCRQRFFKTYFSEYHAANTICIIHQDEKRRTAIGSSACDTKCQTAKTQPESCLHITVSVMPRAVRRDATKCSYAVCNEISVSA